MALESREGFLEEMTSRLETHLGPSKGRWVKNVPDRGRSMHKGPEAKQSLAVSRIHINSAQLERRVPEGNSKIWADG